MAAFTRANSIGWAVGDPVTSAQMNALDTDHVKAPNFVDGDATYNPAALIQIGGAGLQFNGPTAFASTSDTEFVSGATVTLEGAFYVDGPGAVYLRTSGRIVVQSTGEIAIQNGGDLVVESGGGITWESGSLSQAESGATVQFASGSVLNVGGTLNFGGASGIFGTLTVNSTATTTVNGTFTLGNSQNVQLSPARTWTRHGCRMCATSGTGSAFAHVPDAEVRFMTSGKGPQLLTKSVPEDGARTWIELDDLPHGQTISTVTLRTSGNGSPGSITDPARYKVVRWQRDSDFEDMSATVNDSHTTGNWGTVLQQSISVNAHATIDRAYRYAVQIIHHDVDGSHHMITWGTTASGTYSSLLT